MKSNIEEAIKQANQWLRDSGIQNKNGEDIDGNALEGSVNGWFDLQSKTYPFAYPEITGYALTTWSYFKEESTKENLMAAGKWLIDIAHHKEKGFRCLFPRAKNEFARKKGEIYTFDTGIIINGLANAYRITNEFSLLNAAKKAGEWLISIQQKDGAVPPVYNSSYAQIPDTDESWSTVSGSFQAKIALGMLNLFELTGDGRYREFAQRLCEYALIFQNEDGRFNTYGKNSGIEGTNLHPHCYSAEGLLNAGMFLKKESYIEAAGKATEWILANQKEKSITPRIYADKSFNYHERTDIIAQSLRLSLILDHLGYLPKHYKENVQKTTARLLAMQYNEEGLQRGGFIFGSGSNGERIPHVNAWCTIFAMQTLDIYAKDKIEKEMYRLLI